MHHVAGYHGTNVQKQNWITVDISASLLLLLSIFNLTALDIYIFCHNTGSNSLKAFANWYKRFA